MSNLESTFKQIKYPIYPQSETLEYESRDTYEYERIYSLCQSLLSEENLKAFYLESKGIILDELNSRQLNSFKTNVNDAGADLALEWTGKSKVFFAFMSIPTDSDVSKDPLLGLSKVKNSKTSTRTILAHVIKVPKETNPDE